MNLAAGILRDVRYIIALQATRLEEDERKIQNIGRLSGMQDTEPRIQQQPNAWLAGYWKATSTARNKYFKFNIRSPWTYLSAREDIGPD